MDKLPLDIYRFLEKVIKDDIGKFTVTVHNPNKKGEGFMGHMCYVSLKDKNTGQEIHSVVKQAFTDEVIRNLHPVRDMYLNEIYFYTKLWPRYQEFQDRNFKGKKFDKFPKCLGTDSEVNSEKLMLENLKQQGFETFDKGRAFDKNHVELVFKAFGKFHAISIAFRALDPQGYSEITEKLTDQFRVMCDSPLFQGLAKEMYKLCLDSLVPGKDDDILQEFKKYVEDGMGILKSSLNYSGKYPVVLLGDCWTNNMMFKYDQDGSLVDLRLLDLQMMKQGSAASDLAYCLYCSSSKEIFNDLNHYLKVYYNSLSDSIRAFGCNPDELYPFQTLKDEWKQHCKLGFTISMNIWKSKLTNEADVVDLSTVSSDEQFVQNFMQAKYDVQSFKERTRDIIVHLYENDFL